MANTLRVPLRAFGLLVAGVASLALSVLALVDGVVGVQSPTARLTIALFFFGLAIVSLYLTRVERRQIR